MGGTRLVLKCDAAKVKSPFKGNLIVSVFISPKAPATGPAKPANGQRRVSLGTLPAIPFEVTR